GMGYIEETGAAQFFRDARIATIYEGTTGIQAKDFLGRKILRDQGATFVALLDYLQKTTTVGDNGAFSKESKAIKEAFEALNTVLHWTLNQNNKLDQISAAFNFLMATGATLGGYWLLETAARMSSSDVSAPFGDAKTHSLTFYVAHVLPRVHGYAAAAMAGSDVLLSMSEAQF
ncbi:MAG: acyl-CoA dehydrogenase, partial [Gammaproteobacteria bacterium]|nr:acyl-CoA dehydrogenase [Gammaproteobacteria bacterium]